jgi:hypothetical protein
MYSSPRPPKFGSRLDFERAVLEIRWLQKSDEETTAQISRKYNLPQDLIRAGVRGLRSEDYLVGTSKWWPVISQWNEQYEEAKYSVQRAIAYKARTSWDLFAYLVVAASAIIALVLFASAGVAISGISVSIGLFIALYRRSEDWNAKVEDEIHKAEAAGYPQIARDFLKMAEANPLLTYYLFKRFSKERAPHIVADLVEVTRDEKGGPIPVFMLHENVDVEYARRVAEIKTGLEFLEDPFKRARINLRSEKGQCGIHLLFVSLKNGNLPLSENAVGCRVVMRRIDDLKVMYLPWLSSEGLKTEGNAGAGSPKEVWDNILSTQVSYAKREIAKGETCSVLLGFGLSTTGNFYLATEPISVAPLKVDSARKKHKDSLLGVLPFGLEIQSENFAPVASKEVTLIGSNWEDLIPRFIANTKFDGKRIAFSSAD